MNVMPNSSSQPGQTHHRRIHYIDHVLQKWMLIALVVLEVVVLSVAGAILYVRLNIIADESLYRIHFAGQPSMFSVLLKESLQVLGGLVAANLVALFVADRIWTHYVRGIVHALRGLLSRTRALDLRADADQLAPRHKVLALAQGWRLAERARHLALRESFAELERVAAQTSVAPDQLRACLLNLRGHLPLAARRNSGPV